MIRQSALTSARDTRRRAQAAVYGARIAALAVAAAALNGPILVMPAHAKDAATEAMVEVGKSLKGTIDSTAKAVGDAVTSTMGGKPANRKKRTTAKPKKSDQQTREEAAKKPASADSETAGPTAGTPAGATNTGADKSDRADSNASKKAPQERAQASQETAKPPKPAIVDKDPVSETVEDTAVKTPANAAATKSFPRTLDEAKAEEAAAAKPPETWSETEIAEGRARCAEILKRISAVAIQETPIRQGACGTPAPIQLISIGKSPEVSISPPAILTCDMAEKLAGWLESDLQPLAKTHLGAPVIKIETMSAYSCRNAYGRAQNKLSEHGIANALDIRGFVTATAKTAMVLEDWGTPQREILARIAAEKAKAERLAAEKAAAEKAKAEAAEAGNKAADPEAKDGAAESATGAKNEPAAKGTASGLSLNDASHLGGPRLMAASTAKTIVDIEIAIPGVKAPPPGPRAFLHQAHAAACRIFGTTLGPEANAAHRNHFHVDMAKRKSATTKICD